MRLLRVISGKQLEHLVVLEYADGIHATDETEIAEESRAGAVVDEGAHVFGAKGEAPRRSGASSILRQQGAATYAKMPGFITGFSDFDGAVLYETAKQWTKALIFLGEHGTLKTAVRKSAKMESSESRRFGKIGNSMNPGGWKVAGVLFFLQVIGVIVGLLASCWSTVGLGAPFALLGSTVSRHH